MSRKLYLQPSAFLPVLMSGFALLIVGAHLAINGRSHASDEGAAAHLFQILVVGQVPLIAYFAFKWMRQNIREGIFVVLAQTVALVTAFVPVYLAGL